MKVIQLGFLLHLPYELREAQEWSSGRFGGEESFQKANQEIYQPFFAFLERNTQKYRDFHFTLMVSGAWLEQAEKYDAELIERLKKMVKAGRVELVSMPYYYSLSFFYAREEMAEQVRQYQERLERLFGVTGRIFALPELIYNDVIGKWVEEFGFAGMLVGGSAQVLDWRSPNHVYEATDCKYLRLLVRNSRLSDMIELGDETLTVEKKCEDGATKQALSVKKFRKILDLDLLRGGLVNLYLDAAIFARQRERGIVAFFDELVAMWLSDEKHKFVTAAEACMVETPKVELSVKTTVSWRGDAGEQMDEQAAGLVVRKEIENVLPDWLNRKEQVAVSEMVYGARRQILASQDEKLATDLRRLMLVDYHKGVDSSVAALVTAIIDDLKRRAEEIKKTQAVEISRAYTKKRDRGDIERKAGTKDSSANSDALDDSVVKVNFGRSTGRVERGAVKVEIKDDDDGLNVPVQRGGWSDLVIEDVESGDSSAVDDFLRVAEDVDGDVMDELPGMPQDVPLEMAGGARELDLGHETGVTESIEVEDNSEKTVAPKRKRGAVRKIIKRLVIE